MLVEISRAEFAKLDGAPLVWACIEPTIAKIRGKNLDVKRQVSSELNEAQQALLMFQVLYGHTRNGAGEFFEGQSYMLSSKGVWAQFRRSAEYFKDGALLRLLRDMEEAYCDRENGPSCSGVGQESGRAQAAYDALDAGLWETLPASLRLVSAYIQANPELFVSFTD